MVKETIITPMGTTTKEDSSKTRSTAEVLTPMPMARTTKADTGMIFWMATIVSTNGRTVRHMKVLSVMGASTVTAPTGFSVAMSIKANTRKESKRGRVLIVTRTAPNMWVSIKTANRMGKGSILTLMGRLMKAATKMGSSMASEFTSS